MKMLCIGDIVGKPGRAALQERLASLRAQYQVDVVVANAENAAGGSGLTGRIAKNLYRIGCDALTLGDHVWDQKDLETYLDEEARLVRPANFPAGAPGQGAIVIESPTGVRVGIINLLGRVFMRYQVACPFETALALITELKKQTAVIIVDMHAETTSEKVAMGHFLDGKVTAMVGTHTHIQTADAKILSNGTAYITDLGMTGPYDSVIGQNKESILKRFLTSRPVKFQVAKDEVMICGVVIDLDPRTGRATEITPVQEAVALPDPGGAS